MAGTVAIVIPARFASSRYPGKPLVPLRGADGMAKPLIQRSWEAAITVAGVDHVTVATDDTRIAEAVTAFGGRVVMTPESCANGTERCAAALEQLPASVDIVVNLQGDAPLTPSWFAEAAVTRLREDGQVMMATPVVRCAPAVLERLLADQAAGQVGGTTAVFGEGGGALYFSKRVLPYVPAGAADPPVFLHVGLYAYRREALDAYARLPETELERLEGLEQLRFLANGLPVAAVEVDPRGRDMWELNNPGDVPAVEAALAAAGIA